jgi:upstream activation factor subunit UAF30
VQKESDKRVIVSDAKLFKLFGVKEFTAFSMNKYLAKHYLGKAEGKDAERAVQVAAELAEEDERSGKKARSASSSSTKKKSTSGGDGSVGSGGGGGGGLQKPLKLSPELAAVMGQEMMARTQVNREIWVYIKVGLPRQRLFFRPLSLSV